MKFFGALSVIFFLSSSFVMAQEDVLQLKYFPDGDWAMWSATVKKAPDYPKKAVSKKLEGCVNIYFDITSHGLPGTARVLKSIPGGVFDNAALTALKEFKYEPSDINKKREPILTNVIFTFSLSTNKNKRKKWLIECGKI